VAFVKAAKDFLQLLHEQGVISKNVRRVIIDAEVGSVVKLYIEEYGDSRLLDLITMPDFKATIKSAEVHLEDKSG